MFKLLLSVNISHIATLRNACGTAWPDPVQVAFIAEKEGADRITVHMHEDCRHINDRDVHLLRKMIQTQINLEIAVTEEMLTIACSLSLHFCCLVPKKRQEVTTEGWLDVVVQRDKLRQVVTRLSDAGIQVSLFIDADKRQIASGAEAGTPYIEIYTGAYADAADEISRAVEFTRICYGVQYATPLGLKVNAGHGLDYHNVKPVAARAPMHELNIGYAIISRVVMGGLAKAVKNMKRLMRYA